MVLDDLDHIYIYRDYNTWRRLQQVIPGDKSGACCNHLLGSSSSLLEGPARVLF